MYITAHHVKDRKDDTAVHSFLHMHHDYGGPHRQDKRCLGLSCSPYVSRSDSTLR